MGIVKKKNKLKKYWHWYILLPVAIAFFIGTSAFNYKTQYYSQEGDFVKWGSPDEAANYTFAKLYGQTGRLSVFEGYNLYTKDIMHPRSIRSDHGELKPVSFLGIILIYGQIVKLTSYKLLPYLTPFFGAWGLIFYYLLIKKIFKRTNALLSVLLAAGLAPLIYYSARSMFHNVLFISLLIIGFYFLVLTADKARKRKGKPKEMFFSFKKSAFNFKPLVYAALGGFFIGLAIITRASELLWLAPVMIFLWLLNIRKIGLIKPIIILAFIGLALLPAVYYNQILYGAPYSSGYPEMNQSLYILGESGSALLDNAVIGQFSRAQAAGKRFFDTIFHFGFHPWQSARMLKYYYIEMFPYLFWPAVLGALVYLSRRKLWQKRISAYLGAVIISALILVFYYGSWKFFDNPDKAAHTIGNSYTRYWLPIYLGFMPLASLFIMQLSRALCSLIKFYRARWPAKFKGKLGSGNKARLYCLFIIRLAMVALILFISIRFTLYGSSEGLIAAAKRQIASQYEWQRILKLTESNSTVITRYHDKLLFPERKVINGLFDDPAMNAEYAKLAGYLPVYYYNFTFPDKDLEYLNTRRLKEAGLGIEPVEKITDSFTLYKLYKIKNNQKQNN